MKNMLIAAHPYYKYEKRDILIREIGNYFNSLLLYSCFQRRIDIPDRSKEWYIKRITVLMEPLLKMGDFYPIDFYNEHQKQFNENTYTAGLSVDEIEDTICNVPRDMPVGFSNEIRVQRDIYNMLYFLLDISAQGLDELTTPQRIWLYSKIMDREVGITVAKQLSLKHPTPYQDTEYSDKLYSLYALGIYKLNVGRDGIPVEMEAAFRSAIDCAKEVTISKPYDEYEISSLYQLLYLEILSMVQDDVMLRKCRRCGKYFVVNNRKLAYCNRVDRSGLRCSDVGSRQAFQKKLKDDEPLSIYNRAYKTHHARVKKGTMGKNEFLSWCNEAKLKLAEVRAGELDIVTFQKWLKK